MAATYRVDVVPKLLNTEDYVTPCGMNTLRYMGGSEPSNKVKQEIRLALKDGQVAIISKYKGELQEYKVISYLDRFLQKKSAGLAKAKINFE